MAVEQTAQVVAVVAHGPSTRSIILRPDAPFACLPGSFVSVRVPTDSGVLQRAYSIASLPAAPEALELLIDRVPNGPGSGYLFDRVVGDVVTFTGPWGAFTLEERPETECIFVAIDSGIAPIRPMLHRACSTTGPRMHLVYATTSPRYRDELTSLPGLDVVWTTPADVMATVLHHWVDDTVDRARSVFICGVGDVVLRLRDALRAGGYARRSVRYERW